MKTHRISILGGLAVLALGFAPVSLAANVALQNATATYYQGFDTHPDLWHPRKTIDGHVAGGFTSWAAGRADGTQAETIVWETQTDLTVPPGTSPLTFNLYQGEYVTSGGHNLGRFRLSYTTDDRATFADGLDIGGDVTANWIVIDPVNVTSAAGVVFTKLADSSILVSGTNCCYPTYAVTAEIAAVGITGFRMEAMKDDSLPWGGPGREPHGNFHLSEFVVNTIPEPASALLAAIGLAALAGWRRLTVRGRR